MNIRSTGFTLIELIVAMTIGGIILASVMGSFLTLSNTKQQLDITRQIQRELSFATIRIADRVRSQAVDYSLVSEFNTHKLPLEGNEIFRFDSDEGMLFMNDAPLFSKTLIVQEAAFIVSPENINLQPLVRLELRVANRTTGDKPAVSIPVRTSISSRIIQ